MSFQKEKGRKKKESRDAYYVEEKEQEGSIYDSHLLERQGKWREGNEALERSPFFSKAIFILCDVKRSHRILR